MGVLVGGFGTLVGAGGGFLLTPSLLLLFPEMSPGTVTAISMTTVFFNSTSGSIAYSIMKRVDYKTGVLFAAVTLPGSIIGTFLTYVIPRTVFDIIFGLFMVIFAVIILVNSKIGDHSAPYDKPGVFRAKRIFTDKDGHQITFSFNLLIGLVISFFVGFLSGLLGIGGGIVHVPALIFLGFPAHFATATSQFVLACSSLASFLIHLTNGALSHDNMLAFSIAGGAVIGAQAGAVLSRKIKGSLIMIFLAIALIIVGIRIFVSGLL